MTFRTFGPLHRFDHHSHAHPDAPPAVDQYGRAVLYVAEDLDTAASEVFGDAGIAGICPNYRIAIIEPIHLLFRTSGTCFGSPVRPGQLV